MKNKTYGYKTFKLSNDIHIDCETYDTRYSWGHKAYLYVNGIEETYKKITYYNRTWEAYTYQSILSCIVDEVSNKIISKEDKAKYQAMIASDSFSQDKDVFKSIAMIAKMGELLTNTQSEANDWKARMLKAGMGEGLRMPDDWGTLSEDDKQARLDRAIQAIA